MDSRKSVGLPEAPQPGSVSQDVFVGEGCEFECAEAMRAGRMMTKCATVNPETDGECREISKFRKVMKLARTARAREKADKEKGKKNSRQKKLPQNNSTTRHNYVESPARRPGETPWAQGTTKTEKNSSSSRQSYLDQNINRSRQNDDVLIALTSSQSKPVKEKKLFTQSDESLNNSKARQNYVELPARSRGETLWAQGTTETEENSSSSRQSYFEQNSDSSRNNDDVLIALTSSQGKSAKEKKTSRQSNESQNNSDTRQYYVELPALSPGETPWAQGSTETEENNSSSRQSYFDDQNTNNSRQNDDVLIALTSSRGKSVNQKKTFRQSTESQNNRESRLQPLVQGRPLGYRTVCRKEILTRVGTTSSTFRWSCTVPG